MWPKLENLISEDELEHIRENVRTKIEGGLVELHEFIESLKNENTELSAVSERQQFQFEKELFESQTQLKESSEECTKLRTQISDLEDKSNSINSQLRALQKLHDSTVAELQTTKRANELLSEEKKQLFEQLEKRKLEVEKLNEDTKCLLTQLTSATEAKHAAIAGEEEAKLTVSSLQHQVSRLDRERSLFEQQVNDMNNELSVKNHEILTLRKEKSTLVLELQAELENRVEELHHLQEQVILLKAKNDEKDGKIEGLAKKIQCLKESSLEMEEQYQLEIIAQTKLVDLYKKASEDNQGRVIELVSAFEEARKLLEDTSNSKTEAETRAKAIESQYKVQVEKLEQEIKKLKNELKHVNDLAEGKAFSTETLENFFPTAAATSKVIRSGMTLTQMYSEYVKAQEEIQQLKSKNQQQSEQIEQIIAEIEENTPVINQRMADYYKALETITCLRTQITNTLTDQNILQTEKSDLKRKCGQIERENGRLKLMVSDLNRQIQTLLKEIEELRGGVVKHDDSPILAEEEVTSTDELTAEKVISKHLVTYRDITELQTKNQQLLAVVRELSEKQEQQDKKLIEEKTLELQKDLQNAMSQIEDFRNERIKQTKMIESIIRQRDMFRVLLANKGCSDSLLGSPHPGSPGLNQSMQSDSAESNTKSALTHLQSEFDNYKKEKAENERMLNDKLDSMRSELSVTKVECSRLNSQLEYSEERIKLLQSNIDNYKKETAYLRDKNQKHTALITQHQQTVQNLQQELRAAQEKLAKNSVTLENLRSERDLLKSIEERLIQEKESLLREQRHKSEVLANLQAMQNNMERFESDTKRNLKLQIEKYEKDTALLKMKIDSVQEEYQSAVKVWEKQEKELQQKINTEVEKNRKLHEDLVDAYSRVHAVSQQLSMAKQGAGVIKIDGDKTSTTSSPTTSETKSLKEQLLEAQAKVKGLQEQLDLTRKSCERYLTMCNDLELRVKEQDEINQTLKDSIESSIHSSNEAKKSLEQHVEKLETDNRALIEENMRLSETKNDKFQELQKRITELQSELESQKSIAETATVTANQAREDCLNQKKIMEETQEKYERELILHANAVQDLSNLKEEHQNCTMKLQELTETVDHTTKILRDKEASWGQQEQLFSREQESLKARLLDLQNQNESLLHEVELLSTQLAAFRNEDWDKLSGSKMEGAGDVKDTQHWLQIIRFIKNEKEILSMQFDTAQSENVRLKLKVEQLTSELGEVKKELNEVNNNQQVRAVSDAQHNELLRKIEMLNLLTESNNLLRLEKENLTKANQELETKLNKLQEEIQPLIAKNKDLSSQIELSNAENEALRQEVKNWQSRTNQLLEQSHRIGPQEYRNLTSEMDELKSEKQKLIEELQKKQNEAALLTTNLNNTKKELDSLKSDLQLRTQEIQKRIQDDVEHQKTMVQVKKIGRKYKTQYDELKILYDELVAKTSENSEPAALQEMQTKLKETQQMSKAVTEEFKIAKEKWKEEKENLEKNMQNKEDRFKTLMAKVRQEYKTLTSNRDALQKEKEAQSKENEIMKKQLEDLQKQRDLDIQGTVEENATLKSQYESKIVQLEKDLKSARETIDYLEKQQEMRHKIVLQQKPTKATTDRGNINITLEPLMANIKPLTSPAQSPSTSLRHPSPSSRTTPTASIRPMAIGTTQTRMAAVLPTSAVPPPVEEVATDGAISTSVPHATVPPIPATATVAPTTVTVTLTPSAHTPVISEVTTGISQSVPLESTRIETVEPTVVEAPAPTASVIVSPPATQTQMVTPTVKRPRDEISHGSAESPDSSASAQKRVRMISEGSQTNQQASSSNIAIVSAAMVVNRNKEIPTSEVTPNVHVETTTVVSSSTSSPVFLVSEVSEEPPLTAVILTTDDSDKTIPTEELEDQNIDWEESEELKSSEFAVEVMEEEAEVGEHMEDFDDERVSQDEDMVDDQDVEAIEMGVQPVDDSIGKLMF